MAKLKRQFIAEKIKIKPDDQDVADSSSLFTGSLRLREEKRLCFQLVRKCLKHLEAPFPLRVYDLLQFRLSQSMAISSIMFLKLNIRLSLERELMENGFYFIWSDLFKYSAYRYHF